MPKTINDSNEKSDLTQTQQITYSEIASKLLQDRFLLSALELHTELVESGREIIQLKEFFSNPGNFEQTRFEEFSPIARSGSQATLDSLDLTRFSEDGERTADDRVAVLEFELRKAKETINALRTNLTVATESDNSPSNEQQSNKGIIVDTIKPHEQRALNFLINEYLLNYGYKLTSITFADENEDQDFEDWDDVGLNIPKPYELLVLYREAIRHASFNQVENSCQVNLPVRDEILEERISILTTQMENYKILVEELENEKQELQKQYQKLISSQNQQYFLNTVEAETISGHSSESPERFEMIEKPEKISITDKVQDNVLNYEDEYSGGTSINENDIEWSPVKLTIHNQLEFKQSLDNESISSLKTDSIDISLNKINRKLPDEYKKELLTQCYKNICTTSDTTLENTFKDGLTEEKFLSVISNCLPQIIPNIILNKREEIIPLLLCSAYLSKNNAQRDNLLHQLFNLKKRPSAEERKKILAGILAFVKNIDSNVIENELLTQCWEQISHKYVERRLLVVETCILLVPYISSAIRNSLMLSMLQQMLTEDREPSVREVTVQALTFIIGLCEDIDKYTQCEELVIHALNDSIPSVVSLTNNLLLPVLAKWSLDTDKFQSHLMKKLFKKLRHVFTRTETISEERIIQSLNSIYILLPFTILSIAKSSYVINHFDESVKNATLRSEFIELCSPLTNPNLFYEGQPSVGELIITFQLIIKENIESWPEFDWFKDTMLQELIAVSNYVEIHQEAALQTTINLFRSIAIIFGKNFTKIELKRLFDSHIQNLEHSLAHLHSSSPKLSLIPIYLNGIINNIEFIDDISTFIKKFVCALSLSGTPVTALELAIKNLCDHNKELQSVIVGTLWECIIHQRVVVRSSTCTLFASLIGKVEESLLINRVCPALVTLSSDSDVSVRISAVPCIGSLITSCSIREVHDKAYMQLQSVLSDPSTKSDHALLCQIITTLGHIANASEPWFREEVILPQLANLATSASEISNQTRRKDITYKLLESFSIIIYCPMSRQTLSTCLLPGLRGLEKINLPTNLHQEQITMMIKDVESRLEINSNNTVSNILHNERPNSLTQNVNLGVEDMRQRMSKILSPNVVKNVPNSFTNLQGIFKKK